MTSRHIVWQASSYISHCARARIIRFQGTRAKSTDTKPPQVDIDALLKEPSWSVRETLFKDDPIKPTPPISKDQLHHLLRLSALPLPKSPEEEAKLIRDLQAQLKFVQAIQEVDTEGVEPLQMIRDETEEAAKANTITMETLREEFAKEEVVGKRGRIRKKSVEKEQEVEDKWDPLVQAGKTQGPYFVVDTTKD